MAEKIELNREQLEEIIFKRIVQMTEEVKFPNDEDADVCTNYIMKDLGFKVEAI